MSEQGVVGESMSEGVGESMSERGVVGESMSEWWVSQ